MDCAAELHSLFRYDGVVKGSPHHWFGAGRWIVATIALSLAGNAQKTAPKAARAVLDCGALAGQELRCPQLGFTYKVPFGWVDRTEDLQSTSEEAQVPPDASQQGAKSTPQSSSGRTLLAVFQRPPEAPGATINSAVIIAAEPASDYPKIKSAGDYFGPLGEIAEQRGLKMDGDPYAFAVGTKQLARGDFTAGGDKAPVTVRQTSLVTIEKGYILSFTFVSSSEDEIEDLISGLSFGVRGATNPDHRK
jgi:hypothetical protein